MKEEILHKTSANMDGSFFDSIIEKAELFKLTHQQIFKDLINLLLDSAGCEHVFNLLTEYQDHTTDRWETFYYTLDDREIEVFSIARQKYKISISKLAFMAFVLFWDTLLLRYSMRLTNKKTDYSQNSYTEITKKFQRYREKFIKRLNIIFRE